MTSRPISWLKAHLSEAVAEARESSQPLVITQSGSDAAVLVDAETWRRTRQSLAMLKLVAMSERQLEQGQGIAQREVFRSVRARLASQEKQGKRRR
jgi:prevent-host-death family protein